MPNHDFAEDEWIGSIAAGSGHASWRVVWNDSANASLRKKRDPNLLLQGDTIWIPPPDVAKKAGETATEIHLLTGKKNKLVVHPKDRFRIRIVRVKPYLDLFKSIPFRLTVGVEEKQGTITKEGQEIVLPLAPTVTEATLDLGGHVFTLKIGGLGPLATVAGIQGRLTNLGWDAGPVDNVEGPRTKMGVRAFQSANGLKVDGIVGSRTRGKAKDLYGC